MKREERKRFLSNQECVELINKNPKDITTEERNMLINEFTGFGSIFGKTLGMAQFYTPDIVCEFIGKYINQLIPKNSKVLEPSAGTGSLIKHVRKDVEITCIEIDKTSSKIISLCYPDYEVINDSAMNFDRDNYYDAVISNPPFNISVFGGIDKWECSKFDKKSSQYKANSDALFLELAIKSLKVGGYGIFILPSGIGYKSTLKKVRQQLIDKCWIIANIELPPATFSKSGTNVKTHILIFRKAPNIPKFSCTSKYDDHGGEFLLGQPPIQCIQINDIGFDERGKITNRYIDNDWHSNQLEEALERLTDDLYRHNTCPEKPSWSEKGSDITQYIYWSEISLGYKYNKNINYPEELVYFSRINIRTWM